MDKRLDTVNEIDRLYALRNTQPFIANKLGLKLHQVRAITKALNYSYTRKITPENIKEGESFNPFIDLSIYKFL